MSCIVETFDYGICCCGADAAEESIVDYSLVAAVCSSDEPSLASSGYSLCVAVSLVASVFGVG